MDTDNITRALETLRTRIMDLNTARVKSLNERNEAVSRAAGLRRELDALQRQVGRALTDVAAERGRQDAKWGEQNHPDGTGPESVWMFDDPETGRRLADALRAETEKKFAAGKGTWLDILLEEVAEAFAEDHPAKLREELIQVAAVAVNWAQAIDRRAQADLEATRNGG